MGYISSKVVRLLKISSFFIFIHFFQDRRDVFFFKIINEDIKLLVKNTYQIQIIIQKQKQSICYIFDEHSQRGSLRVMSEIKA